MCGAVIRDRQSAHFAPTHTSTLDIHSTQYTEYYCFYTTTTTLTLSTLLIQSISPSCISVPGCRIDTTQTTNHPPSQLIQTTYSTNNVPTLPKPQFNSLPSSSPHLQFTSADSMNSPPSLNSINTVIPILAINKQSPISQHNYHPPHSLSTQLFVFVHRCCE